MIERSVDRRMRLRRAIRDFLVGGFSYCLLVVVFFVFEEGEPKGLVGPFLVALVWLMPPFIILRSAHLLRTEKKPANEKQREGKG